MREQIDDFLYAAGYHLSRLPRAVLSWRPHHLWCQARAFRSANSTITMSEGSITLAMCEKCGIARAYDTVRPVYAGDLVSSSAFKPNFKLPTEADHAS